MNYFFITGTGRGIGKALAELILHNENNFIYGLSRSNGIKNKNFQFLKTDLNDTYKVKSFEFPEFINPESIILVNNSMSQSEIIHLGKRTSEDIIECYNVNILSPSLLMNNFIGKYQDTKCRRIILNISSGAAFKPIEAWSTYCATKAALAMMIEVTDLEQKLKHPDNPVYVFSVSPGVVNTDAQRNIRKTSPEDFSMVGKFIEFYETNQLAEPEDVAVKLYGIIQNPEKFDKVAFNINEI